MKDYRGVYDRYHIAYTLYNILSIITFYVSYKDQMNSIMKLHLCCLILEIDIGSYNRYKKGLGLK